MLFGFRCFFAFAFLLLLLFCSKNFLLFCYWLLFCSQSSIAFLPFGFLAFNIQLLFGVFAFWRKKQKSKTSKKATTIFKQKSNQSQKAKRQAMRCFLAIASWLFCLSHPDYKYIFSTTPIRGKYYGRLIPLDNWYCRITQKSPRLTA